MQDLCIFDLEDLFFFSTWLKVLRQDINSSISFALLIINPKVILSQLLSLPDLSGAQVFCIYEMLEVVMVCEHENFMLAALQVLFPSLERFNNY